MQLSTVFVVVSVLLWIFFNSYDEKGAYLMASFLSQLPIFVYLYIKHVKPLIKRVEVLESKLHQLDSKLNQLESETSNFEDNIRNHIKAFYRNQITLDTKLEDNTKWTAKISTEVGVLRKQVNKLSGKHISKQKQ